MKIVNLLPSDYYTQRNNSLHPLSACMPTSYAMFLRGNRVEFQNPTDMQDDDYFMKLLQAEGAWEKAVIKYTALSKAGYPPNEIHGMYHSYLDLMVVGYRVSDFATNLSWDDFLMRIYSGEVVMTSGTFPGLAGHAFCVIGVHESTWAKNLVLADPWGDYHSGYRNRNGYCVEMSREDFERIVKPGDRKWGHVLYERRAA